MPDLNCASGEPPTKRPRDDSTVGAISKPDGTAVDAATIAAGEDAEPPLYKNGGYIVAGDGWWAHAEGKWLYNTEEKTYFNLLTGKLRLETEDGTIPMEAPPIDPDDGPEKQSTLDTPDAEMLRSMTGEVASFNLVKGFGFIRLQEDGSTSRELFFHKSELEGSEDNLQKLKPGVHVTFLVDKTDDGRSCAVRVQLAADPGAVGVSASVPIEGGAVATEADDGEGEEAEEEEAGDDSSGSSVELDLFEELQSGSYQIKGEAKDHCEDYVLDKVKLPISVLGETATCVFFGVFDGHGGSACAEYAHAHLAKNVLARLRDRTKTASDEAALRTALSGGFKQTEHNFLQHARKVGDVSGTTACTMTVFGPDEQMRLRLFMANAGDSRAVLGKAGGGFLRLTEDHKPNLPAEKKRIELEGGGVAEVRGVWRCILPQKKQLTSNIVGLAVSRSLGDKDFKNPNLVSPDPDITVHEIDWDDDEFVILASDGIWDVLSDKQAVRIVQRSLRQFGNQEKAAQELVHGARDRGSKDDCAALVVRFGWLKTEGGTAADDTAQPEAQLKPDFAPQTNAEGATRESVTGSMAELQNLAADNRTEKQEQARREEHDGDDEAGADQGKGDEQMEEEVEEQEESEEEDGQQMQAQGNLLDAQQAAMVLAMRANGGPADDEDDDIFAGSGALVTDTGEGDVLPFLSRPLSDTSAGTGLFDGLGPTKEDLALPNLPSS